MNIFYNIPIRVLLTITLIFAISILLTIFNIENRDLESEESSSGALESLQFMSQVRAYPNIDIPQEKFYQAFEYSKNYLAEANQDNVTDNSWTSIGPNNVGGRSLFLAIHPVDTGTIFIGSASGGLWKSTTGGLGANAWTYINTGYPSNAVSCISIDSLNPNTMYIGTGECYGYQYSVNNGVNVRVTRGMYGIGILKTTDGGTTWTKSLDWSYNNQRGIWRVIINQRNHNILYAATTEGVYKSYNAGTSWNQILNYPMVMDLILNAGDTTTLIASVGDLSNDVPNSNTGIYRSTNSGSSWTKISDGTHGLPTSWSGKSVLCAYQPNPSMIYASISNDPSNQSNSYVGLYMSVDNGNTWTLKYSNASFMTNQGWYNNAFTIKGNDVNSILLGNLDVYRSTNGGSSFTQMSNWQAWINGATPPGQPEGGTATNFSHADQHYLCSNPKDPNKIYSITDGGLYRSNDFGTTYYSCNGGYVTTQFYASLGQSYTDSVFCVGGLQDNRAVFYQGTTAWYKTFQGDGFCSAVNSQNNSICYTEYSYGDISRSANGGVSWTDIAPPFSGSESNCCFCSPYVVCRTNPLVIYAGGTSIYKSTTGQGSWQGPYGSFGGRKVLSLAVSNNGTDTLYCGVIPPTVTSTLRASVFKSVNGGTSWTEMAADSTVLPNRYPTGIHIDWSNANTAYVTFGGFNAGHVYKTVNGGVNWTNITGNLPDVPTHCVITDPLFPSNVYIGNELGVYFTTNNGANWTEYRTGMPYTLVFDLKVVLANRKLRAVTHGNGIYERKLYQNPLGINDNGDTPEEYKLSQNYPNPFNPHTRIDYSIPKSGVVTLKVYNLLGKEVSTLVSENKSAGSYSIIFNGSNLTSGIYFYRLTAGNYIETRKMLLIK